MSSRTIAELLDRILAGGYPADEDENPVERIEGAIAEHGWVAIRDALMAVLEDETRTVLQWEIAAAAIWGAVLDRRPMHADRVIALVYARLSREGELENNLAWSIAAKLRGVGYLSEYDPLTDPAVLAELRSIRGSDRVG